jgi:hypothetical protein
MNIVFDYSGLCEDGKKTILEGIVEQKIDVAAVLKHSNTCPVCREIVDEHFQEMLNSVPAPFSNVIRILIRSAV